MTAQVPPSVDYGNINDLLRQANGESEDTFVWKDQRRQSGNESGIAETGKSDNLPVEVKEKPRGKKKEAVDKNAGQARHARKAKESPNTVPGINDKAVPLSSPPATSGQHLSQKPADEKKHVSTDHANISHDEIMEAVSAFGKQKEAAHRHMIFMPDKLYHDLVAGYGQRNLSAILCTLARLHVEKYKLAMRQMITSRTDFLE